MAWVKMDDSWPFNRKLRLVEPLDRLLWAMAIPYCSSQNTDGRLDGSMLEFVAFLAGVTKPYESAERLVAAQLFDLAADGWHVHDYLEFNFSASQREDISAKRAEAGRRGGYAKAGNVPSNSQATSQQVAKQTSSRPVPSRPVPSLLSSSSSGRSHQESPAAARTTDDDDRTATQQVIEELGRADHVKAMADGVAIRNKQAHLEACIARRRSDRVAAERLHAEHPDWTAHQIAQHILDPDAAIKAARRARVDQALGGN